MFIEDDDKFEQVSRQFEHQRLEREAAEHEKTEAVNYVDLCLSEVGQLGANDSEPSDLRGIKEQMLKGELSPKEARRLAHEILKRKMDYH